MTQQFDVDGSHLIRMDSVYLLASALATKLADLYK